MNDKPRLPFALLDGALSGVQSAVRTVTGLAKAPFSRSDETPSGSDLAPASGFPQAEQTAEARQDVGSQGSGAQASDAAGNEPAVPTPVADTAASPTALAAALDEKATRDLGARAEAPEGSIIDRIPRADASHSGHEQPAPDEELGPEPFTPQVGP